MEAGERDHEEGEHQVTTRFVFFGQTPEKEKGGPKNGNLFVKALRPKEMLF